MRNLNKEFIIKVINEINKKYSNIGFKIVSLFGSYARGDNDLFSDIDLTYIYDSNKFFKNDGFKKAIKIEMIKKELQKIFKRKVDLIPYKYLDECIKTQIKKEQIII